MKKWPLVFPIACIMAFSSPMLVGDIFSMPTTHSAVEITLTENYDYTSDISLSRNMENFAGAGSIENATFDGKGKTIKLSTKGEKQGLFKSAKNAVIKNVKVEWKADFSAGENISSIFAGAIVGEATDNTVIENCEVIFTGSSATEFQDVAFKITMGGIAGKLTDSSIQNCGVYGTINLNFNLGNMNYTNRIGSLVGSCEYSKISNCINFSNFAVENGGFSQNLYLGGLVGSIEGEESMLVNSVNAGSLSTKPLTGDTEYKGGVVGYVKSTAKPAQSEIAGIAYVENSLLPFGSDERLAEFYNSSVVRVNNANMGDVITESFYTNPSTQLPLPGGDVMFSWYGRSEKWNFDSVWSIVNLSSPELRLQSFQSFTLNAATSIDPSKKVLEKASGSSTAEDNKFDYGYDWTLKARFKDEENIAYYRIVSVLKGGNPVDFVDVSDDKDRSGDVCLVRHLNNQGQEDSYTLYVKASSKTEGEYSFEVDVIEYTGYLAVANVEGEFPTAENPSVGGKAVFGGGKTSMNFSRDSSQFAVRAIADLNYKFTGWKVYRPASAEEENVLTYEGKRWIEIVGANLGTASSLSNKKFGEEYFEKDFLLLASFSDNIYTLVMNFDENQVSKIKVGENDIMSSGSNINIDRTAPTSMKVYMKSGYALNESEFNNFLKSILDEEQALPRVIENLETDGTKSYSFSIVGSNLKSNLGDVITFNVVAIDESLNRGLNLGAIIGGTVSGVVLLLAIILFLLWWFGFIGHRGYSARANREEKKKQNGDDYKKYFF